ncbi:MAG: hypothetical protein QG622_2886 [Actinomycetota bacterium]|nr:hypothetical protein [Actinomycetota bacterium]
MSPVPEDSVLLRLDGLEAALAAGGDHLDSDAVKRGHEVAARLGERLRLGADRTVVALVGATGSGKSSMFNALAGMELSEVGVRRPTTGEASACVWAAEGADPLLDWLDVPRRQRTNRESVLDGTRQSDLHGLVLLDLPDHDSTQPGHRLEAERLVGLVDLLVWVVDPQKYADEALHAYLRGLRSHAGVMLVVLNQIDTLTDDELPACAADLRRLLDADGLSPVVILTTSTVTGLGVGELRTLLADLVERRGAFAGRALADLEAVVADLSPGVAASEADPSDLPASERLVTALADAAGLPVLIDAVTAEYRRRCAEGAETLLRWGWDRWRSDPLNRLGLSDQDTAAVRVLTRVDAPRATPAQRDRVELAVRDVMAAAASGLPGTWADAVRSAGAATGEELSDTLDEAVGSVDVTVRRPMWWNLITAAQLLLLGTTLAGLLWWLLTVVGIGAPRVGSISLPMLLLAYGAGLSALVVLVARWSRRVGAERRGEQVASDLRAAVSAVAAEKVLTPIAEVISAHRSTREALSR